MQDFLVTTTDRACYYSQRRSPTNRPIARTSKIYRLRPPSLEYTTCSSTPGLAMDFQYYCSTPRALLRICIEYVIHFKMSARRSHLSKYTMLISRPPRDYRIFPVQSVTVLPDLKSTHQGRLVNIYGNVTKNDVAFESFPSVHRSSVTRKKYYYTIYGWMPIFKFSFKPSVNQP